jgi:hypothetical protein
MADESQARVWIEIVKIIPGLITAATAIYGLLIASGAVAFAIGGPARQK